MKNSIKKIFVLLLLTATQGTSFAKKVVYLKDGSTIEGNIIEIIPNESAKIEDNDGNLLVFKYNDIEKITEEDAKEKPVRKKEKDLTNPLKRGNMFSLGVESMLGSMYGISLSATYGHQFNPHYFLGVGTGVRLGDDDKWLHFAVPIFVKFRHDLCDYRISPFYSVRAGATIPATDESVSGFYGSFDFGCRFKRFSISTGIETVRSHEREYYRYICEKPFYGITWDEAYRDIGRQVANFVLRCAFNL